MLEIGQSKAIVLQKLHSMTMDGKLYSCTYQDWRKLIPYISYDQIKRILIWLENKNLVASKIEKNKSRRCYSVNYKSMSAQGFEVVESSIFHKKYQNKKMSFILPSLVNLVGITSAIFLQDLYYQHGNEYGQMTQKEINKWVPYTGLRQVEILFRNLQKMEIIKSEFRDESNKHDGKYYLVNRQKIDELLISPENGQSRKRSGGVDNSLIVDNFNNQSRKRSGLKSQKIGTLVAKDRDYSIDQDQVRSFKKTIHIPRGADQECDTIPNAKDNIVCLTERLMTHGFTAYSASQRINEFGLELLNRVIILAADKEKATGESVGPGWITATAKNLKKGEHMNLQTIKSEDSIYRRLLEAETQITRDRHALMMVSVTTPEKAKPHLSNIRSILRISKTIPESNRDFAKRVATGG